MTEKRLCMPCGCQVGPDPIGKGLELKYCGIHAYAPALFIEVLDVIDYFSDDWPEALADDPRNLVRKGAVVDLIKQNATFAPSHNFSKSEHWPAIDACIVCGKTEDEGNHF